MSIFPKQRIKSKDGRHEIRIQPKSGTDGPYAELSLWEKTRYSWKPTGRIRTVPMREPQALIQESKQLSRTARTLKYSNDGAPIVARDADRIEQQLHSSRATLNARLIEAMKSLVDDFEPDGGGISV